MNFRTQLLVGTCVASLCFGGWSVTDATAAGTNDHFANRRRAAAQAANPTSVRPWGGPTTGQNWWTPNYGRQYRVNVPYYGYPAYPGYGYGVPPYYSPYYSPVPSTYYGPAYYPGRQIYIERRINLNP